SSEHAGGSPQPARFPVRDRADGGRRALPAGGRRDVEPELVVVDLSPPGEGGANTAGRVVGVDPERRPILPGGPDGFCGLRGMLSAGVAGFVLKRSAATDLVPAVKEVLGGGTYVCPALQRQLAGTGDQTPTEARAAPPAG